MEGLRRLLEPEFDVVGMAEDGVALLQAVQRLKPAAVLLALGLPRLSGIEAAARIRQAAPEVKVLFLTAEDDAFSVAQAVRAGASGYLLKRCTAREMRKAIHEVLCGRRYVTSLVARRKGASTGLTRRQQEVLRLVAKGYSGKQIAASLSISPRTVEFHKSRIFEVLGIRTTAELTKYALAHGLLAK